VKKSTDKSFLLSLYKKFSPHTASHSFSSFESLPFAKLVRTSRVHVNFGAKLGICSMGWVWSMGFHVRGLALRCGQVRCLILQPIQNWAHLPTHQVQNQYLFIILFSFFQWTSPRKLKSNPQILRRRSHSKSRSEKRRKATESQGDKQSYLLLLPILPHPVGSIPAGANSKPLPKLWPVDRCFQPVPTLHAARQRSPPSTPSDRRRVAGCRQLWSPLPFGRHRSLRMPRAPAPTGPR
jgi:hypothetical protein